MEENNLDKKFKFSDEQVLEIADYIIRTGYVMDVVGQHFNTSTSTLSKALGDRLYSLDQDRFNRVREVVEYNKHIGPIRAGAKKREDFYAKQKKGEPRGFSIAKGTAKEKANPKIVSFQYDLLAMFYQGKMVGYRLTDRKNTYLAYDMDLEALVKSGYSILSLESKIFLRLYRGMLMSRGEIFGNLEVQDISDNICFP
jgi:hypothetical protein